MRNIKIIIEYHGRGFNGWQKQPNKLNIQGELEKGIGEITGEEINLKEICYIQRRILINTYYFHRRRLS